MAGGLIFMAILGCGDAGTGCEQVGRAPVAYQTMAQCNAAQASVLATVSVDYPEVAARCQSTTSATAPARKSTPRYPVRLASARG